MDKMKLSRITTTAIALSLAGTVTASSMYVTLNAAANQDAEKAEVAVPVVSQSPINDRSYDVAIDSEGRFSGRISTVGGADGNLKSLSGCTVTLVSRGRKIGSTTTDDAGVFSFTGLTPGVYAILASGQDAYLVSSFRAVESTPAGLASNVQLADGSTVSVELQMNSVSVFKRDFAAVKDLIQRGFPKSPKAPTATESLPDANGEPSFGTGELGSTIAHHQVQLQADGSLAGEISLLEGNDGYLKSIQDMTVYFVMDNTIIGSTVVNPDGSFKVQGLTPGLYSVVAVGADGVLATGVDILGAFAAVGAGQNEYQLASVAQALGFAGASAGAENFVAFDQSPSADDSGDAQTPPTPEGMIVEGPAPFGGAPAGGPIGGGGGGPIGGGGGGPLGGSGGLGTLLGAAVGAGVGFAIADNNDNDDASPKN